MYTLATCTGSILRGTSTDVYGDEVDAGTVVQSGVQAAVQEKQHRVFDPATQAPRVVRSIEAYVQSDVDIRDGDQFRDDTNNITYAVVVVTQPGGPAWTSDLSVELQRINGRGAA